MKRYNQLSCGVNFLALSVLLFAMQSKVHAQIFQNPIGGNIYGQPIVACTGATTMYEYAATDAAIYARPENKNNYYSPVWTAPGALHISSFDIQRKGGVNYRAVLLHDGGSNYYVVYNKINAYGTDSTIHGPVILPVPFSGKYIKIVAGGGLYVYSMMAGGPPGNISVSRDNGATWQPDTLGIGYDVVYDLATDTSGNVFMAGAAGIYKQIANDSTWIQLNANPYNAAKIFVDRQNRILISNYGINTHISLDNGATFIADSIGISGAVSKLAGDAYGNLYAIAGGIFRNTGGTGNWMNITSGFNTVTRSSGQISCISGDSLLTIGTGNYGMFTSTDQGLTWSATDNGIHAEDIYSIITQPDGRLVCTTDLGIFYKEEADTLWHPTNPISSFYPGSLLYNDKAGNIFVAVAPTFGSPYPLGKSTDNGLNFIVDSAGFSAIGGSGFYIDETGDRHFYNYYATGTNPLTVWTSRFGSSTWSLDTAGLPVFPIYGTGVKAMCGDRQGYLYAGVDMPSGDVMYRRPVSGNIWVADTVGLGASLIISPMASNASLGIIVARGAELYRRTANGWLNIPNVPASEGINALSVDSKGVIYLSCANYSMPDSSAVFLSKDTGVTWLPAGLEGMTINNLVSSGDTTYALTFGNWGFVINGNGYTGVTSVPGAKSDLKVFPNPSTSGVWNIQTGEEWISSHFEIYDVNGRVVYRGVISNSETQVRAQSLASGVYVLRIFNATGSANGWMVK